MNLQDILAAHAAWLRGKADGKRADLTGADLSGADLRSADLRSADLSGANLSGADLSCADLAGADLSGASLWCADLAGADLSCASLWRADLAGADLSGASLWCADLAGANLAGADLPEQLVLLGDSIRGRRRWAWLNADGSLDYIRCGCKSFASLDEARAHFLADGYCGESAGRLGELRAALDYWAAMIDARAGLLRNSDAD